MATEVVKVIDPDSGSGYDYDSLYDWEAAQQGDLTGARDEIAVAKCRCTGGTADTTAVTIDGWTTSATDYIKIWTDPSESYRHNGTWQTGNKYRLQNTLTVKELFFKLNGIQIYRLLMTEVNEGSATWFIVGNVFDGSAVSAHGIDLSSNYATTSLYYIINNLFQNYAEATYYGVNLNDAGSTCYLYSNTCVDCRLLFRVQTGAGTCLAINNLIYSCVYALYGTFLAGSGYNATNDALDELHRHRGGHCGSSEPNIYFCRCCQR